MNNQINTFISSLVDNYSKYSSVDDCYTLNVNDVPDYDLHTITSIFLQDKDLASEANGPDNEAYEKSMLPALIRYMSDITDRDEEIEFNRAWREGVTSYFKVMTQELINEECANKLHEERNSHGLYARHRPDNNEIYWASL